LNTVGTITTGIWNATAISVANGGTGLTNVEVGGLLIGSGSTDPLGVLQHPDSGGTIKVLQASGSLTTRKVYWADAPVAGVAAVNEGNGIEISGTGANPVVNARLYKQGDTLNPPANTAVLAFYNIEGNSSIGIPLGTGAAQAAAGDHTHDWTEILNKPANLVSSSAQINTLIPNIVSASSQVNHNQTTNYVANQHIDHSTVSITAGSGLSGGGNITTNRTLTLDTGSAHFTGGVDKRFDAKGLFSGSAQVQINNTTGTLNVNKGGTGKTSVTLGSLLVGAGTDINEIAHPQSGGTVKVLQASGSLGSSVVYWADPPVVGLSNITEGDGIFVTGTGSTRTVASAIYTEGSTLTPPTDTGVMKFVDINGKQRMGIALGSGPREAAPGDHIQDVNKGGTGQTSYTNGQLLIGNNTNNTLTKATLTAGTGISITNGAGSISIAALNNGTVTSVAGTGTVSGLTLSGTVTTSGNITLGGTLSVTPSNFASQTAKTFLAAPNATNGTPSFRTIVASDIPILNQNTTGQAGSVAQSVTFNNGGAGAASGTTFNGSTARTISYNTIGAPSTTGTNASGTWGINITGNAATATSALSATTAGSAATVSGVVAIANGGTNATTVNAARDNLDVPARDGNGASGTWGISITGNAATATTAGSATTAGNVTGTVAIANGGTGATDAATARSNLGAGTVSSVAAGNGMNFTTITGTGTVTLGTPATLTATSTNSVTSNSHTHALDGNIGRVFVDTVNPSGTPARAGDITFVI
jgi:hypothetical protein